MKNFENIPKKTPFKVPDGYFDELPMIIQSRVAEKSPAVARPYVRYALQYALPAVLLMVVAFFIFKPAPEQSAEEMLAAIDTESLVAYIASTDISMDELIEEGQFDTESVQAIEDEVYFDFDDLNIDDLNLENLDLDSGNNL